MLNLVISALLQLLKEKLGAALLGFLETSIEVAMDLDLSGEEKRAKVIDAARNLGGEVSRQFNASKPWIINLAIESLVTKLKL